MSIHVIAGAKGFGRCTLFVGIGDRVWRQRLQLPNMWYPVPRWVGSRRLPCLGPGEPLWKPSGGPSQSKKVADDLGPISPHNVNIHVLLAGENAGTYPSLIVVDVRPHILRLFLAFLSHCLSQQSLLPCHLGPHLASV